ncbi:hypothetical protein KUTG_06870 [Kutzneria sp. 744]|nr:hypothetical protein [Kutzneria sp. 744]EWM16566.1 hypothetical protein KUTG_06870 [Kutzneria sp. 744]
MLRHRQMGAVVANLGDVLTALGQVAVTVESAGAHVNEATTTLSSAGATLTEALGGSSAPEAGQATEHMAIAINTTTGVEALLRAISTAVGTMVERIVAPGGPPIPSGARAARAPVAGRTHPTHTPVPPPSERDHEWAARIRDQLTVWKQGRSTEALVFDTAGQDWQVNSGVDAELTAAAEEAIETMIANGEVGASANVATNSGERTAIRYAADHAETKAAVWAAASGSRTWCSTGTTCAGTRTSRVTGGIHPAAYKRSRLFCLSGLGCGCGVAAWRPLS